MNTTMKTIYEQIGGEPAVRQLARSFYHHMDSLPEVKILRDMHPKNLNSSEEKLFEFLSGWMGGPQLFIQKHGHPMLRARHLPFKIGSIERDQWLLCFAKALEDVNPTEPLKGDLFKAIARLADHMRNQEELRR